MNPVVIVPRTCTEVPADTPYRTTEEAREPQPLSEFRTRPAYVLLGDPGSGKTTAFEQESRALGEAALMLSARDFIAFGVDSHPEWHDKTLFIDGLDEMRAGATDSRSPLDQIRGQLDRLGRPSFRLSCREADWMGTNDRRSLDTVSTDGQITVLRFDPLSKQAADDLLRTRNLPGDASEFVDEAQQRGVAAMLANPLTLELLADAVAQGGEWPQSRRETFDLACQKMSTEWNDEHRAGAAVTDTAAVLDAAGWLCAQALLTGAEGYSLAPEEDDASFVALEALADPPSPVSRDTLVPAVATALFTTAGNQRFRPRHRHIAEFLGGRHLARLIQAGLPARRVVALMTSPADGRVVTVLRGLSAWLAAHSTEARRLLIEADPVGVGLYGDISAFTFDDKEGLLRSLEAFAAQSPSLFAQRHDLAKACRSLACGDMAPAIQEMLNSHGPEAPNGLFSRFLLDVLSEADDSELESLRGFGADLEAILFNPAQPPQVKESALDAYIHIVPPDDSKTDKLLRLLNEVAEGTIADPDDQIRGKLLTHLYPANLSASQIWQHALHRNRHDLFGYFDNFWHHDLLRLSSAQDIAGLLDALHEDSSELFPALSHSDFDELPLELLARGLEEMGERIEPWRRYNWLNLSGREREFRSLADETAGRIRVWLEDHPDIQKGVFLAWLRQPDPDDRFAIHEFGYCEALHRSRLPADFGRWCLEQAVAAASHEPGLSEKLLRQAFHTLERSDISEGLTLDVLRDQTRGYDTLAQLLEELCRLRPQSQETSGYERQRRELFTQYESERQQRRDEWETELRAREGELRGNRFPSQNLHTLAKVYFRKIRGYSKDASPEDRLGEFIGGDPILIEAVMIALREAVFRDDIPEAADIISLKSQSKLSYLVYPLLASLELLHKDDPARLDQLSDVQQRRALAIYYCYSDPWRYEGSSLTHDRWLNQNPELVFDVLYRCAVDALKRSEEYLPGLNDLDRMQSHYNLVNETRIQLLEAYPPRGSISQLPILDRLLADALKFPNIIKLQELTHGKLSMSSVNVGQRVRWLAVGALLSPGHHREKMVEFLSASKARVRYLAEFLHNSSDHPGMGDSILATSSDSELLRDIIRSLGRAYSPLSLDGFGTISLEIGTSRRISSLIEQMGSIDTYMARQALTELIDDPELASWRDYLKYAFERQSVAISDASYGHPSIEQVGRTLSDRAPANVGDLTALLSDRLADIADNVRGGSSNLWRQYWNEDSNRHLTEPKHEESCRDALVESLKVRLPDDVDAAPEGRYASDKRADIRVSYGGRFNVPIEIKKNNHLDLWSALRRQLIGQYTTDPATSGYGIYLVLWFGAERTTRHPDGNQPTTPDELRRRLEEELTADEARKISVVVLDVTKPA